MPRDQGETRKSHASFRFAFQVLEALHTHAEETGETMTALAERYVDEGLRRDEHPLIVFRDGAAGRRAALAGTRLDVSQVIETVRASDKSIHDAAEYLSIPEPWVAACVRYYADYRDEIDGWIERMHATAEREEDAWRRTQSVFA
jgi:uncharacterized protein (DUF433 family)